MRPFSILVASSFFLSACVIQVPEVSPDDRSLQAKNDLKEIFAQQNPPKSEISLAEAIARAVKYNLDLRVKLMEEAIASDVAEEASFDMLPKITSNAGYNLRSDRGGSTSETLSTGAISTNATSSQEKTSVSGDLSLAWGVLDFGVSWARARQQGLRQKIAMEQRRKALHTLIKQVRTEYWRAVTAEQLNDSLTKLSAKIRSALVSARKIEDQRLESPAKALEYQKTLLDIQRRLLGLRRDVLASRANLARLMNLDPGMPFRLAVPKRTDWQVPQMPTNIIALSQYALRYRPELYSADYNREISMEEINIAFRRMLPGLELNAGLNYDSNSFLVDNSWATAGMRLTWNLLNIFSGPKRIALAENREQLSVEKRRSLSMAVLAQVHVSYQQLLQAREAYKIAQALGRVDERLLKHSAAGGKANVQSELQLIRQEAEQVFSRSRRNQAYSRLIDAEAQLALSIGLDPARYIDRRDSLNGVQKAVMRSGYHHASLASLLNSNPETANFGLVGEDVALTGWKGGPTGKKVQSWENGIARPAWKVSKGEPATVITEKPKAKPATKQGFFAHLGSFSNQANAQRAWTLLLNKEQQSRFRKETQKVTLKSRGTLIRLYAAGERSDLATLCQSLSRAGNFCKIIPVDQAMSSTN